MYFRSITLLQISFLYLKEFLLSFFHRFCRPLHLQFTHKTLYQLKLNAWLTVAVCRTGLILYRGTICSLTEKTSFLYRYFKELGQKISSKKLFPLNPREKKIISKKLSGSDYFNLDTITSFDTLGNICNQKIIIFILICCGRFFARVQVLQTRTNCK